MRTVLFLFLLIISCSSLNERKISLESNYFEFKKGQSFSDIERIMGKPDNIRDLKKHGHELIGWYYHTRWKNTYKMAIFFDRNSRQIKTISWNMDDTDKIKTIDDIKNLLSRSFEYRKKWKGAHSGGLLEYYEDSKKEFKVFVTSGNVIESVTRDIL